MKTAKLKKQQFYPSNQNDFNSLNQFWCNQQVILIKTIFSYMIDMKNQFKNTQSQIEHEKISSENRKTQFDTAKTQFENAKTQKKHAQVLAQVFLDRCSKKAMYRFCQM